MMNYSPFWQAQCLNQLLLSVLTSQGITTLTQMWKFKRRGVSLAILKFRWFIAHEVEVGLWIGLWYQRYSYLGLGHASIQFKLINVILFRSLLSWSDHWRWILATGTGTVRIERINSTSYWSISVSISVFRNPNLN